LERIKIEKAINNVTRKAFKYLMYFIFALMKKFIGLNKLYIFAGLLWIVL